MRNINKIAPFTLCMSDCIDEYMLFKIMGLRSPLQYV